MRDAGTLSHQPIIVHTDSLHIVRNDFKSAVEEAIKVERAADLLSLVEKPDDAVALIALLDQMPRNIYRNEEAKTAYNLCDPKARELSVIFAERYREERKIWNHVQQWIILYMPCERE